MMKRYKSLPPLIIVCAITIAVLVLNLRDRVESYSDSAIMMDTVVEISVWGKGDVPPEAAVEGAFAAIARVESLFGNGFVQIDGGTDLTGSVEYGDLIEVSRDVHQLTAGMFDPTIGAISRLWEWWEGARPPGEDSLARALADVGLPRYLEDTGSGSFVLDLGGVAKGYAVDLAAAELRRLGFTSAIINAGGDLRLLGKRPDGRPWRIAIRHPREASSFIGYLDLEDTAVATSGDYERFFLFEGKRYHHILDPRTGLPGYASNSVTVVAPDACRSDALATGLFLLGPQRGGDLIRRSAGIDAVFVHAEGDSITVTPGLMDRFGRFESD
jgi:thiamine biosynthesis lipoprotein